MHTVVSVIKSNIIEHQFIFIDTLTAEKIFVELVAFHGGVTGEDEVTEALDDGYCDCEGVTICIGQPDADFNNDYLMSIREAN